MKRRRSSLKKVILTVSMLAVFLVATVVSVVLVLAAQKGSVATSIDIEYVVDGVTAQISANYAVVPNDTSQEIVIKEMKTAAEETEIVFEPSQAETAAQLLPSEEIVLNTKNQTVVFEYVFENLGDSAFSLQLVETPERENISQTYFVSAIRLSASEYRTRINTAEADFHPQAVTEFGQTVYVYVKASIEKAYNQASYDGTFAWAMLNEKYVTVNLNNGDGEGKTSLKVIQTSEVANIDMPVIATLPTSSNFTNIFDGYYSAANGGGTKYISSDGTSANIADVTSGQTLYANYITAFNVTNTTINSLTDEGKALETITIPDGITAIDANAFEGSQAEVVYVPASVQTIGESAFEGNTVLRNIVIEDGETVAYADEASNLASIGARAFYGCTNLETLSIPESVTSIGTNAFAECSNLLKIDFGASNMNALTTTTEAFKNAGKGGKGIVVNIKNNVTQIPNFLFCCASADDAPNIVKINFEENSSVTVIGGTSLARLANLKEISIPEGVTEIGSNTFRECSGLTKVEIPSTLTEVGYYGFSGCTSVTEVYATDLLSWMNIDFSSNESSPVRPNSTFYVGGEALTELVIPNSVTKIKNSTFTRMTKLTSVTIPEGVTSIGYGAFWGCKGITNALHIPASVTTIGDYAFRDLHSLTSVTFAENSQLQTIGYMAFYYCTSLTSLTIPKSVTSIGSNVVGVCYNLTTLVVEEGNTVYNSGSAYGDGSEANCIIELATNKLVRGCKSSTIPEGVEIIGNKAFMYSYLSVQDFVIPSSVKTIEDQAFYYCYGSIKTLTIPSSVTSIGKEAFKNYNSLTNLEFESTSGWFVADTADATEGTTITISDTDFAANATLVKTTYASKYFIKGESSDEASPASYFNLSEDGLTLESLTDEGKAATEIIVPSTVTTIAGGGLANASATKIVIPNTVTSASYPFMSGCTNLETLEISADLIGEGDVDMGNYSGLDLLFGVYDEDMWELDEYAPETLEEVILNGGTKIGIAAFSLCSDLINVSIPSSVTTIEKNAFDNCNSLAYITIPSTVTSIGSYAFEYCVRLTSISIPSSVESIGENAFSGCFSLVQIRNLSGIDLTTKGFTKPEFAEDEVTTAEGGFVGTLDISDKYAVYTNGEYKVLLCSISKKITDTNDLPSDLTYINQYAFSNCSGLISITIPESVTSIGYSAFSGCKGLTSVRIPSSVTSIGSLAFLSCSDLTDIYYDGTEEQWNAIENVANASIPDTCTIHYES